MTQTIDERLTALRGATGHGGIDRDGRGAAIAARSDPRPPAARAGRPAVAESTRRGVPRAGGCPRGDRAGLDPGSLVCPATDLVPPAPRIFRPSDGLGDVAAACLVGAVVYAAQQRGSGDQLVKAGPALDYLWDAWQESRGLGGTGVAGRAAPRELRMARVRDLTRWNDQPGRTREEVLGLVDLAASRAVMAAVNGPR